MAKQITAPRDRGYKGSDLDAVFASCFVSTASLTALSRASARFDRAFPGWQLYHTLLTRTPIHFLRITAYAKGMAWMVARARKLNGRRVVPLSSQRAAWIEQAGLDGLHWVMNGEVFPCGLGQRAHEFKVRGEAYQRVRDGVADGIRRGVLTFSSEACGELVRAFAEERQSETH
jgi:hypothetical protein